MIPSPGLRTFHVVIRDDMTAIVVGIFPIVCFALDNGVVSALGAVIHWPCVSGVGDLTGGSAGHVQGPEGLHRAG
jgi:hypothetical protein